MVKMFLLNNGMVVVGICEEPKPIPIDDKGIHGALVSSSYGTTVKKPRMLLQSDDGGGKYTFIPLFGDPEEIEIGVFAVSYELTKTRILEHYQKCSSSVQIVRTLPKGLRDGKPNSGN